MPTKTWRFAAAGAAAAIMFSLGSWSIEAAQAQGAIVAIVNDEPISEYDIDQRAKLLRALGGLRGKIDDKVRKRVLNILIEEHLQRQEARRLNVKLKDKDVDDAIRNMARRMNSDVPRLKALLEKRGVHLNTLKLQIDAVLAWQRIVRGRYGALLKVSEEEIDRRFEQVKKKPAPSRKIYVLRQVLLPLKKTASPGLIQSRQIEAQKIITNFKGCGSIRSAIKRSNAFDVRVLKVAEVPADKLTKPLRQRLDSIGPGRIFPAGRTPAGFMLLAYCNKKTLKPPPVTREMVQNSIYNEQVQLVAGRYLRDLRRDATVEIR